MITIHLLTSIDSIMAEGRRMQNALGMQMFAQHLIDTDCTVVSVRDEYGVSVANLAIDSYYNPNKGDEVKVVTNIVGPRNERVSDKFHADITEKLAEDNIILPAGLKFGGQRMCG